MLKPGGIVVLSSHDSWYPLVPLSVGDLSQISNDVIDLYLRKKNRRRIFSRYKTERVPLGEVESYLSNPIHQWLQLRKCGFTLPDIVGRRDGLLRVFERNPHYVVKSDTRLAQVLLDFRPRMECQSLTTLPSESTPRATSVVRSVRRLTRLRDVLPRNDNEFPRSSAECS